jgi:crotonobetainyl-CoA:carnitine CoA-transferase CaiB-like acyl-CoA transferase
MLDATIAFFWPEGMAGLTYADQETDVRKTFSSIDLVYETRDGYVTASVISNNEWEGICTAFGREELIADQRFATALARRKNAGERREIIANEIAQLTTAEVLSRFKEHDVPTAPLLTRMELLDHPQILASETVSRDFIEGFGEVRQAKPAAQFQLTPSSIRLPALKLGEHSLEILESLGYDEPRCRSLLEENIVLHT